MAAIACGITYFVCTWVPFDAYVELFVKAIVCAIVPNVVFLLIFGRTREFADMLVIVNRMTGGKIKPLKRYIAKFN